MQGVYDINFEQCICLYIYISTLDLFSGFQWQMKVYRNSL